MSSSESDMTCATFVFRSACVFSSSVTPKTFLCLEAAATSAPVGAARPDAPTTSSATSRSNNITPGFLMSTVLSLHQDSGVSEAAPMTLSAAGECLVLRVPLRTKRRAGRKEIIAPDNTSAAGRTQLVHALRPGPGSCAQAHQERQRQDEDSGYVSVHLIRILAWPAESTTSEAKGVLRGDVHGQPAAGRHFAKEHPDGCLRRGGSVAVRGKADGRRGELRDRVGAAKNAEAQAFARGEYLPRKLDLATEYAIHRTLLGDLKIAMQTVLAVLRPPRLESAPDEIDR